MTLTIDDFKRAAEIIYPEWGAWSYEKFDEFNKRHFNDQIPPMPIQWHDTLMYGGALGLATSKGVIKLGIYKNKSGVLNKGQPTLYGAHVLLHEMIHQYLFVTDRDSNHSSTGWREEIMRVGAELGLSFNALPQKVIKVKDENGEFKSRRVNQDGSIAQADIARFPLFAFNYATGKIKPEFKA